MSMQPAAPANVQLPPGVTIVSQRETTQANAGGQIVQGIAVTIRIASGAVSTVFIPNSALGSIAAINSALTQRANQLMAIESLSNPSS